MNLPQPYLIQRLSFRRDPSMRYVGVDRHFELDYMGSAEFEFGQANHQLRGMVTVLDTLVVQALEVGPHRLWYVGRAEQVPEARALFADQVSAAPSLSFQERPYLREHFVETTHPFANRFEGWWAYTAYSRSSKLGSMHSPWALFTSQEIADTFLQGVRAYAEKLATETK